jgi:hypothetical protein
MDNMNFGLLEKMMIGFGLKKAREFIAEQPELNNDQQATATTLGSKTTRMGLLIITADLGKWFFDWINGAATNDNLAVHLSALVGALALIFFRHAIAKHGVAMDATRAQIADFIKKSTPILFILFILSMSSTGCTTTTAASGISAIAPAAASAQKVCTTTVKVVDIADVWLGYLKTGVTYLGDFFGRVSAAVESPQPSAVSVQPVPTP